MLAFLGAGSSGAASPLVVPQTATAPRAQQPFIGAAAAAAAAAATAGASVSGSAALASQVVAVATVLGCITAAKRRIVRRKRVALAYSGGCYQQYDKTYKAKPGDKYKYRFSTDRGGVDTEFGVEPGWKGRVYKFGELVGRGVPAGPDYFAQLQAAKNSGPLANVESVGGCLLLDCDGTIVETERDGHRVAFNRAFEEKGYDIEWEVGLYGELLTTGGGKERMTRYFTDYNAEAWKFDDPPSKDHPEIVELHKLKTKIFMDIAKSGALPLREGIKGLVAEAFLNGWKVGVCSTSNEDAVRAVVQTALPEFYPDMMIFAGDVVSKKKPDPEIYLLAAKEMGMAPMKCVVVEDTAIGCQAGKAAGMQVIVTKSVYSEDEDFTGADTVLSSAQDLDFESDVMTMLPTLELA